jgi:hypothetical protein
VLNKFNNSIRYPDGIEANGNDVILSFEAVEKIIRPTSLVNLREDITKEQNVTK